VKEKLNFAGEEEDWKEREKAGEKMDWCRR